MLVDGLYYDCAFVDEEFCHNIELRCGGYYYNKVKEFAIILEYISDTEDGDLHEKYYKEVFEGFIIHGFSMVEELIEVADVYISYSSDIQYHKKIVDYILTQINTPLECVQLFNLYHKHFQCKEKEYEILQKHQPVICLELMMFAISFYKFGDKAVAQRYEQKALLEAKNLDFYELRHMKNFLLAYYEYDKKVEFLSCGKYKNIYDELVSIFVKHKDYATYTKVKQCSLLE